jgi:magnesium transporter
MPGATWTDLLDPDEKQLRDALPESIHESALELVLAPAEHEDEPRPRLQGQGDYVFGILLVAVAVPDEDRVFYQEIDLVLTKDTVLTVRKTPEKGSPFAMERVKPSVKPDDTAGMIAYRIIDEVLEDYLDLVDALNTEIEEVDDHIEEWKPAQVRRRIADLRHDMLHIRRTLSPTRDAIREVVDDRVDIAGGTCFPHEAEVAFGTAYDKALRASEGMDYARDLVGSVRDYYLAKVANDQNEVMKRLTVIASLLLVPTFIVGLYGQNFFHIPEIHYFGAWGYLWSWFLILGTTLGQLWYFRRRGWM